VLAAQHPVLTPVSGAQSCGSLPWLCIHTHPNQEGRAEKELRNQQFPVFLPLYERRLPNRHKRIEPLFRSYLFAQPFEGIWAPMRGTRGVADVLRDPDGHPRWVSGFEIDRLLARVTTDDGRKPSLTAGADYRALSGPFASFVGVCVEDAGDRIKMLMSIFGRTTEQWFQPEDVEAV
jgi:transcription antitermination factor NusG